MTLLWESGKQPKPRLTILLRYRKLGIDSHSAWCWLNHWSNPLNGLKAHTKVSYQLDTPNSSFSGWKWNKASVVRVAFLINYFPLLTQKGNGLWVGRNRTPWWFETCQSLGQLSTRAQRLAEAGEQVQCKLCFRFKSLLYINLDLFSYTTLLGPKEHR